MGISVSSFLEESESDCPDLTAFLEDTNGQKLVVGFIRQNIELKNKQIKQLCVEYFGPLPRFIQVTFREEEEEENSNYGYVPFRDILRGSLGSSPSAPTDINYHMRRKHSNSDHHHHSYYNHNHHHHSYTQHMHTYYHVDSGHHHFGGHHFKL